MSDIALPTTHQPRFRTRYSDLGEPPAEHLELTAARAMLKTLQLGAYLNLVSALWLEGTLPVGLKALAHKAGVGPRSFEKMAPLLANLFEHDDHGRWRNLDLEDERARRLGLDPGESYLLPEAPQRDAPVDATLSEKRRAAAIAGNKKRWGDRRARLQLVEGGKGASQNGDGSIAKGIANSIATCDGSTVDLPLGFAGVLRSVATGCDTPAHGPSDGLSDSQLQEKTEESDGRTDARAPVPASIANDHATDRKPTVVTGSQIPATPIANASSVTLAAAVPPPPALPYTVGEALEGASGSLPSDGVIIAALRSAGGGKIPAVLLTASAIAPIRDLLHAGCSLHRDVVPAIEGTVRGLTDTLRSLKAKFIHDAAFANRDMALASATTAASVVTRAGVFVEADTPQWRAWLAFKGVKSLPAVQKGGLRGWNLPSEWPPGSGPPSS